MNRPRKTALDYAIVALSPALIIAMVCSLVWFLLEVFYQGYADANLRFIFFAFVLAAVLISRISIEAGRQRAAMYGIALGLVTWLALLRFVEIRGSLAGVSWLINLVLLGVIWWSISRLTWDCTFLDESKDTSGEGLLRNMGLDGAKERESSDHHLADANESNDSHPADHSLTFRERIKQRQRRPHAHGLWVVYFSLAALPLFGIGQMFVGERPDGSSFFWLIFVYLGSAFGLLVTTSLLGLRKYLRERKIQMPPDIAGSWLTKGAVLVVGLLLVVWLLPRPQHSLWSAEIPFQFGSPDDLETSQMAPGDKGKPDEDKATRTSEEAEKGQGNSPDADKSGGKDSGDEEQGDPSGEKGKDGASAKDGKDQSSKENKPNGDESAKDDQAKDSEGSKKDKEAKDKGEKDKGAKDDKAKDESQKDEAKDEGPGPNEKKERESSGGGSSSSSKSSSDSNETSDESDSSSSKSSTASSATGAIGNLLKWLFILGMLILGAVMAWRFREQIAAGWKQFLAELREFWQKLFGGRKPKKSVATAIESSAPMAQHRPFSTFSNPFASGGANRYTPRQLVKYTFEALEAWARENGRARNSDQTPHEFAQQVGLIYGSMLGDAENLADLYCQEAFAEAELSTADVESLASLWQQLSTTSNQTAIA